MSTHKRIFLTGASAGFGFDTAKELVERGHTVFATMRGVDGKNTDKAAELRTWANDHDGALHVLELDVTSDESVNHAVAKAVDLGGFDVVINNAGLGNWGIDEGFTVQQAEQLFAVNLFGVMRVNRAVVPHLREQGKGLLLYVSSGLGRIIFPFMAVYTASKFALEAYAESTSYELAPLGIETSIIQPGAYGTTFLANCMQPGQDVTDGYGPVGDMFAAFGKSFEERAQSGQLGDPSEVVDAMVTEVERTGERPLRHTVGADVMEPVSAINATCDQVQGHLLSAFGFR